MLQAHTLEQYIFKEQKYSFEIKQRIYDFDKVAFKLGPFFQLKRPLCNGILEFKGRLRKRKNYGWMNDKKQEADLAKYVANLKNQICVDKTLSYRLQAWLLQGQVIPEERYMAKKHGLSRL